jgi:hypothetical protein
MSQTPAPTANHARPVTSMTTQLPTTTATALPTMTVPTPTGAPAPAPQYYAAQHPPFRPPIQFTTTPGPPLTPRPPIGATTTAASTTRPAATTTTYATTSTPRPAAPSTSFVSTVGGAKQVKKAPALKGTFVKDRECFVCTCHQGLYLYLIVRPMMYAFGDHSNPAPDTVSVMEEILMDYMVDVVSRNLSCPPASY